MTTTTPTTEDLLSKLVYDIRNLYPVFNSFPSLLEATTYAKTLHDKLPPGTTLPVFALDLPPQLQHQSLDDGTQATKKRRLGAKQFFVSSYISFVRHLIKMRDLDRNFYETLLPGIPSKLYVDAEFCFETNKNLIGKEEWLEKEFIALLEKMLVKMKIIKDPVKEMRVIVLESSNKKKFSRHYIVNLLNKKAFANNYHCGAFMRHLEQHLLLDHGQNIENNPFYVWPEDETAFEFDSQKLNKKCVIDMGVYGLNRQMRTVGSVKAGEKDYENRVLRPIGTPTTFQTMEEGQRIIDSMIQRIPHGSTLIYMKELDGTEPKSGGDSLASRRLRFLSKDDLEAHVNQTLRNSASTIPITNYITTSNSSNSNSRGGYGNFRDSIVDDPDFSNKSVIENSDTQQPTDTTTPTVTFSDLARSLENDLLKKFPDTPNIQTPCYNLQLKLVTFFTRSHNCENHGIHKSNHVYYVFLLSSGYFIQKCNDPMCKGFKSKSHPMSDKSKDLFKRYLERQDLQLQTPSLAEKMVEMFDFYSQTQ